MAPYLEEGDECQYVRRGKRITGTVSKRAQWLATSNPLSRESAG